MSDSILDLATKLEASCSKLQAMGAVAIKALEVKQEPPVIYSFTETDIAVDFFRGEQSWCLFFEGMADARKGLILDESRKQCVYYNMGYSKMNDYLGRKYMEEETISGRCDTPTPDDTYKPYHYGEN